jgi:hypothetical protein
MRCLPNGRGEARSTRCAGRTLQHGEWTAELGALAQLHNDVEQRMRELVQDTLQAEERHRGEHGWAERTIILAIPRKERERVGSGSADQLLSRLYWTNLIAIIGPSLATPASAAVRAAFRRQPSVTVTGFLRETRSMATTLLSQMVDAVTIPAPDLDAGVRFLP